MPVSRLQIAFVVIIAVISWMALVNAEPSRHAQRNRPQQPKMTSNNLTVALLLPKIVFGRRLYQKAVSDALQALQKSKSQRFEFLHTYGPVQVTIEMLSLTPSPTGNHFLVYTCAALSTISQLHCKFFCTGFRALCEHICRGGNKRATF